jgi:Zn-dependent protease with chaperone function
MKSFVLPTRDDTPLWIAAFVLTLLATIAAAAYLVAFFIGLGDIERYSARYRGPWLAVPWSTFLLIFVVLMLAVGIKLVYWVVDAQKLATRELLERLGAERFVGRGDLAVRRLRNIVEEMAIACGRSVPTTWVMDREDGINAFTAGMTPHDTSICVTRGALRYLRRAELQAVVAHEFGHIVNGDVRRNTLLLRILAAVAPGGESLKKGCLTIVGAVGIPFVFALVSPEQRGGALIAALLFLVVMVPKFVIRLVWRTGVVTARLAHAAFARRCELVADALAVQFTRDPGSLAAVFRKLAGLATTTELATDHAAAVAHMCIADAIARSSRAFASHPPLAERLSHIGFPLTSSELEQLDEYDPSALSRYVAEVSDELGVMHLGRAHGVRDPGPTAAEPRAAMLAEALDAKPDVDYAKKLLTRIPLDLRDGLRTAEGARAAARALLGDNAADSSAEGALARRYRELLDRVGETYRLPLLELTMPALLALPAADKEAFRAELRALMLADGHATTRELVFYLLLTKPLVAARAATSNEPAEDALGLVLAGAAFAFTAGAEAARAAFEAGRREGRFTAALPAAADVTIERLEQALERLARIPPLVKPRVTRAIAAAVCYDGRVTARELEFVRAVGAAVDCPIPPLAITAEEAR